MIKPSKPLAVRLVHSGIVILFATYSLDLSTYRDLRVSSLSVASSDLAHLRTVSFALYKCTHYYYYIIWPCTNTVSVGQSVLQMLYASFKSILQMMSGYLRARGLVLQREHVRQSLVRVDPLGSAVRWSRTVTRRTYRVATPNSLWHLDAHMKLVRYL